MTVFSTESLTNWCPQTASSNAFLLSSAPGWRASMHSTANGVGGRATALPSRSRQEFASSSSNLPKRTRRAFDLAAE